MAASGFMPVNIRAGRVRNVPPPAKAFWIPAHTATKKRITSPVMAFAVAHRPSRGKRSGLRAVLGSFVSAGWDQFGAAHRFAQIAGWLAPMIRRRLRLLLVSILGATPRHEKILVNSNGIIRFDGARSDE